MNNKKVLAQLVGTWAYAPVCMNLNPYVEVKKKKKIRSKSFFFFFLQIEPRIFTQCIRSLFFYTNRTLYFQFLTQSQKGIYILCFY